jgi:hypothetical protein
MSKTLLLTLGFACLAVSMLTIPTQAQYGTLPIGTLSTSKSLITCPGGGWYYYTDAQEVDHYINWVLI